jgi:hypothetical protein
MELLLVRIDHLRDRKQYVGILRGWLQQIGIGHGRLITVGDLHLLFIVADAAKQSDELLAFFRSKPIDSNSRDEVRGVALVSAVLGDHQERDPLHGCLYDCSYASIGSSTFSDGRELTSARARASWR